MAIFRGKQLLLMLLTLCLAANPSFGATKKKRSQKPVVAKAATKPPNAAKALRKHKAAGKQGRLKRAAAVQSLIPGAEIAHGPWVEPTFTSDVTSADLIDGEDLLVRRAAVEALGNYNGTVVVTDPNNGRVLTIVNQKLAFKNGFQPCSTIKIVAALAGLSEGVIDRETNMHLYGRTSMNLTNALAHSNNNYFANVGIKLGYEKVSYYARLFGLGEKAGLGIPEEQAGTLPPAPPANGGMGMMTSFGEGIQLTPLELASLVSAVANGGTLFYLQHPRSQSEVLNFIPRVKRHLEIEKTIPEVRPGMSAAVDFGTARRASYDANEPIFGKTGTCTDRATPTHLGWFGSFNDVNNRKLVVVVLLTGGRGVSGPVAAGIAGQVYRNLSQQKFFANTRTITPLALVSGSSFQD
jgi:cell division protein FtsI/penicillin-binding protein 2